MGSCPLSDILLYDSICSFPQATGHHTLSPSTLAVLPQEQQLEPKKPFQERREREETFAIRSPILNNTLLMVLVLGPSPPFFRLPLRQLSPHGIGAGAADDAAVLRRPVVSPVVADEDTGEESLVRKGEVGEKTEEAEWVDWEDQILQETVPLVGFVRMILHSGKYEIDDRLSSDHEKTIVEKLLLYHPESEKKIGCGVEYIKVGLHPEFQESRCLFIVRSDGQIVDFSYWKCIKGLIRKKYPLYADSFILRHFRRRRPNE
ncbi:protein DCL, chloroplastic isoform X2 [Dendrobium catenatum]|uniref:protein DCL, chloroplastic isoform X2 n=1 Tax=Dendrobium catenatum TaxID=906689 RepID=UPI0009F6641E|nr:protein DCL, chloroplastic isoform X2 [Dendrobium catenatum]